MGGRELIPPTHPPTHPQKKLPPATLSLSLAGNDLAPVSLVGTWGFLEERVADYNFPFPGT